MLIAFSDGGADVRIPVDAFLADTILAENQGKD
jgi:hypothetical protein